MSLIQALILGITQGLTEFLPVSSSGHLKLGQIFFGFENLGNYILFDLFCHLGTLGAVLIVYRRDILDVLRCKGVSVMLILLATLPLFPLVLILKPLKELIDTPQLLGAFFLLTATLLILGERFGRVTPPEQREGKRVRHALLVGLSQALAVLPGVSRSGSTISTACLLGWERKDAARFSFLIAIPAILGGTALEVLEIIKGDIPPVDVSVAAYAIGFVASFAFGWMALIYLLRLLERGSLRIFAWYCAILGIGTLILTNI